LKLYTYYRSSAAYRVRIALNIKGLDYETCPVHLLKNQGENWQPEYLAINPQGLVPTLVDKNKEFIQSSAIIEYLEEAYPIPSIFPIGTTARAYVRALAQIIACEIHPLNNLRVLNYLAETFHCNDDQQREWYRYWIFEGFSAAEKFIMRNKLNGKFCYGDNPTLADIFFDPASV